MAALTIAEIYQFEDALEGASLAFLKTATGLDVFRANMITEFTTPRIEVLCEISSAFDPPAPRGDGASPTAIDFLAYNASFTLTIVTDNAVGQSGAMSIYVGQARAAMARSATNWTQTTTALSGTSEVASGARAVTGTATAYTTELSVGARVSINASPFFTVESITSNTALTLAADASGAYSGATTTGGIPFYDLKELRPAGTSIDVDGDLNETAIQYDMIFEIRRDAWPA